MIISTARKKNVFLVYSKKCKGVNGSTAASRSGKSLEIFVQWTGCPAPLYPTTVLLIGPPVSQPRILPAGRSDFQLRFRPRYVEDRSTLGGLHTISHQRRSPSNLTHGCLMAKSYQRLAALFSLS
ncbi:hypothetical protein T07_13508 [Trichinella nelsoni]|uniref:Uncharacterized protein n=1 Tax=Trichinella nelsoni TaxID=6336 RepID=A0A0V0S2B5_9BILA|nr:hypothetical protein T07_13508 [Trichinella nelsoni]